MIARIGPWIAAAAVGALTLGVGLGIARLAPVTYRAAGQLNVPLAAQRSLDESWPDASLINRWLAQPMAVRPTVTMTFDGPPAKRIAVVAQAANGADVAKSVNQVLKTAQTDLFTHGLRFAQERHRSLLTILHHARAERSRAQRQLDQFVAARWRQTAVTEQEVAAPAPTPVVASAVPTAPRRNPLWDDLARQVGEMEGRRAGLLQTMTEAHPVIRDLDWRLAQLREQLRMSQEFMISPDPSVVQPLPPVEAAIESQPSKTAAVTPDDDQALRLMHEHVAAADRELGFAVQQERAAWQELSELRAAVQSCVTPAVIPTRPIDPTSRDRIYWSSAILGLAFATVTLWRLQPRRKVLRTTDDVRRQLGIPVLGKLSVR